MVVSAVERLSRPAETAWVMARIASLLDPYFDKGTPQSIREMEAEDWAEALDGFPQWAIQRAVRWWKSSDNPNRRKRPLEGDIVARVNIEMDAVNGAKRAVHAGLIGKPPASDIPPEPPVSAERADEIMAEIGFTPKRFGG